MYIWKRNKKIDKKNGPAKIVKKCSMIEQENIFPNEKQIFRLIRK